jgi:hypothetical protein
MMDYKLLPRHTKVDVIGGSYDLCKGVILGKSKTRNHYVVELSTLSPFWAGRLKPGAKVEIHAAQVQEPVELEAYPVDVEDAEPVPATKSRAARTVSPETREKLRLRALAQHASYREIR